MAIRDAILTQVKSILHGPLHADNPDRELSNNPLDFFVTGILYPQVEDHSEAADSSGDFSDGLTAEENGDASQDAEIIQESPPGFTPSEATADDDLELVTRFRPSVAGMSFLIQKGGRYEVKVSFAYYTSRTEKENSWNRIYYKRNHFPKTIQLGAAADFLHIDGETFNSQHVETPLHGAVYVAFTRRSYTLDENLEILTVSLINKATVNSFREQKRVSECLFEIYIEAASINHTLEELDDNSVLDTLDEKDVNLKLLYRNYRKYAIGHGVSVNWEQGEKVRRVWTEVIPVVKVDGVELDREELRQNDILYMKALASEAHLGLFSWTQRKAKLLEFVSSYTSWIERKQTELGSEREMHALLRSQGEKNLNECIKLRDRMLSGIKTLDSNLNARTAFEDANEAMFLQRVLADFSKHRQAEERILCDNDSFDDALPDFRAIPHDAFEKVIWQNGGLVTNNSTTQGISLAKWRPFQLAFLLSQVDGVINPEHVDRDTVDLIWFPTGGGKTEAYLGLIAFTIFWRRLKHPNEYGAGVSVIMRYTLRLLNKQQFERASILICAAELIRQSRSCYGATRITNGIWVGGSMTPNTNDIQVKAYSKYKQKIDSGGYLDDSEQLTPPLLSCPCCGNRLVRETMQGKLKGRWGYFRRTNNRNQETGPFIIACTNTKCAFFTTQRAFNPIKTLPVYEVDEEIYRIRPSLLFATADKMVSLAWRPNASQLFNLESGTTGAQRVFASPDLVLQDELHLISSALGTIYGVFEFVIDRLCAEQGGKPKVVGATATVRDPSVQCERLYGRKGFMQFPPPGIDADDAFYALKKFNDDNARMYVGFMPSGITSSTALIRLTSVLLERTPLISCENFALDGYYSLVVYFNALKELGKFRTFLTDDIAAYRRILSTYFNTIVKNYDHSRLSELSSDMTSDLITKSLDKLEKTTLPKNSNLSSPLKDFLYSIGIRNLKDFQIASYRARFITNRDFFQKYNLTFKNGNTPDVHKENYDTALKFLKSAGLEENDPAHIVPATSMISVGVDIGRLNTMIVNGQPKTTSEYIQASSRVGRRQPGIVFTFLAPTKNRDRSHYELFKDYHQAYYKYVESSSVTPAAEQALEKMVPTVFVSLLKSLCPNPTSRQELFNLIDGFASEFSSRFSANNQVLETVMRIATDFKNALSQLEGNRYFAGFGDFYVYYNGQTSPTTANHFKVYNCPATLSHLLPRHIPTVTTLRNVEHNSKVEVK